MTLAHTLQWHAAHTHPHAEAKAAAHLGRQGFDIYLPRYRKRRRHARRVETVVAPLFPRCLFVKIDMDMQRWRAIQSTVGIAHLVCNDNSPTAVHEGIVYAVKQREDSTGFIHLDQRSYFRSGDKLRVLKGVFSGVLGPFESTTDNQRVSILLGHKARVSLDLVLVAAA